MYLVEVWTNVEKLESYTREFDDLRVARMWAGREAKKHGYPVSVYECSEFEETLVWSL